MMLSYQCKDSHHKDKTFRYFPHISSFLQHTLAIEYHVYIWQVSPQPPSICGETCKIWFKESNRYFCMIENFAYGEINERSFSNPPPLGWHEFPSLIPSWRRHVMERFTHCWHDNAITLLKEVSDTGFGFWAWLNNIIHIRLHTICLLVCRRTCLVIFDFVWIKACLISCWYFVICDGI